jgi:hypothetical protein
VMPIHAAVSFARTPLEQISGKVAAIKALGWREREDVRGDPWAASFVKDFPEERAGDAERELREVMGDYWLDAAEIRSLLASK